MEAEPSDVAPQVTKTRPRTRRADIATNASELFSARGFHAVRMDDIAEASDITARALYRHYHSKQALLSHVVLTDQQRFMDTFSALLDRKEGPPDLESTLTSLTEAALDSRRLSLLWQREARHLDDDDYRLVRRQARAMTKQVETLTVKSVRKDLDEATADIRGWVVVSIITGTGLYDSALPRPRLTRELVAASKRVIASPLAIAEPERLGPPRDRASKSRREQLLYAAAAAFRERGYAGVRTDDIGGQVGIAGPAMYRYFDNKAEILVATINRLDEWLALETTRALQTPCPDEAVLAELVRGYARIALEATDLLAVSLTERLYLPDGVGEQFDRLRTDYIGEWQRWMTVARPDLPDARAATLVSAAKTIIDDCVRIPHFRHYTNFRSELIQAALTTLGVSEN